MTMVVERFTTGKYPYYPLEQPRIWPGMFFCYGHILDQKKCLCRWPHVADRRIVFGIKTISLMT